MIEETDPNKNKYIRMGENKIDFLQLHANMANVFCFIESCVRK